MNNIRLSDVEAKKPLGVDSAGNYLFLKDLAAKKPFMALATLAPEQQRDLVLKRYEMEKKDLKISILGGVVLDRDQIMKMIEEQTDFGIEATRAELSYLSDIQSEIVGDLAEEELPDNVELGPWPPKEVRPIPAKFWPWFLRRYAVFAEDTDTSITSAAASYRAKNVIPCFKKKGIIPIILTGNTDTRPNFSSACKRRGVVYISGVGHGSPTAYTGYNYDRLWEVGKYDPLEVKRKIIHLLSCKTAQKLGPDLIKNGACAYFGYYENFTITWNNPDAFWVCDSSIDLALCRGLNAGYAARIAIMVYNYWIKKMRAIHGPTAVWLTWDRDALRTPLHGNQYGNKACTLRRLPIFEEIESEMAELALEEIEAAESETINIKNLLKDLEK